MPAKKKVQPNNDKLLESKAILDEFMKHVNFYGITESGARKQIFYNGSGVNYTVTRIDPSTKKPYDYVGYNKPVVAMQPDGNMAVDENQFANWYAGLFSPESGVNRAILLDYMLANLTRKVNGWVIAGVAYTCKALLHCDTPLPEKLVVTTKESEYTSEKADYVKAVDAVILAAEANRNRVENDPILRRLCGLDATSKKRTPSIVKPVTGGNYTIKL